MVAAVRKKHMENSFFQVREKSGNFMSLAGHEKVREKSEKWKINGYSRLQKTY